jgi:hypothetical protein
MTEISFRRDREELSRFSKSLDGSGGHPKRDKANVEEENGFVVSRMIYRIGKRR